MEIKGGKQKLSREDYQAKEKQVADLLEKAKISEILVRFQYDAKDEDQSVKNFGKLYAALIQSDPAAQIVPVNEEEDMRDIASPEDVPVKYEKMIRYGLLARLEFNRHGKPWREGEGQGRGDSIIRLAPRGQLEYNKNDLSLFSPARPAHTALYMDL